MKHILSIISAILIFVTFGCTMEMPVQNQETKSETNNTKEMSVHFIDVGQGDSILVQSPNGKNLLIDGGTKEAGKDVVNYLRQQKIEKLDYVVATHPDADHIGGLIGVLNSISIKNFVDSGKVHTTQTYEKMLQLILDKNIPFIVPIKGDKIPLDPDVEITVLNTGEDSNDNNEASIVLKVQYEDVSFLLTGDADIGVEESMLKQYNLKSTILKAGHHGSDTSSSEAFIREVQPKVTVLSYGKDNTYGHPKKEVMARLKNVNSEVYATAEEGNIVVKTNGANFKVSTHPHTKEIKEKERIANPPLEISSKDLQEEIVAITNTSNEQVNLNDWQLVSLEGNQVFKFPDIKLKAGETIFITSGSDAKEDDIHIKWTNRQIWRNDGDPAKLINEMGEVVSEVE